MSFSTNTDYNNNNRNKIPFLHYYWKHLIRNKRQLSKSDQKSISDIELILLASLNCGGRTNSSQRSNN